MLRELNGVLQASRLLPCNWISGRRAAQLMQDLETANLLALARVLVAAALARRESRGAHFREDFPETSADFQHSLVYCQAVAKAVTSAC